MNVKKVGLEDLDLLAPLFDGYMVFYRQTSNLEKHRAFLSDRIKNREAEIFIAVDEDNEGMGFTLLYPSFSSVSQARVFTLNDLYVNPNHRNKGVATGLMSSALKFAKSEGAVRVHLETEVSNKNAQRLYEKEGWIKEKTYFYYHPIV